jgi:tetratricopeptide (TPR) repeat protein
MRQVYGGADDDDIAWILNNLAWCLHAMGRLDEAEPLYLEALAMQRRLGAPQTTLQQTQNNLAGVYYDRGRLDAAEQLWREVLQQYEQVFGAEGHAAVARGQGMVALIDIERGHWDEAVRLMRAAVAANQRLLGEKHRWTAGAMLRLGNALLGAGRLDDAERWMNRANAVQRALLPPVHASHVSPSWPWRGWRWPVVGRAGSPAPSACCVRRTIRSPPCPHPTACRWTTWRSPSHACWRCRVRTRR